MPKPITLYYGETPVKYVYPDQVQYHLEQGATYEPVKPQPVKSTAKKQQNSDSLTP